MMRRHITFTCDGDRLIGTLDEATPGTGGQAGLLLVTGGNEQRSGAWAGQAEFAARIAAKGYTVLRFDRRGCGDSEGINGGFRASGSDITAALAALRRECPQITRVVGMGNCDAATALMLSGGAGCDALLLSNPWTFDRETIETPPEAVRTHYRSRLTDRQAIKRLLTGKVALAPLLRSLLSAMKPAVAASTLAQEMAAGIADFAGSIRFLIAGRDRTGQMFLSAWNKGDDRIHQCPQASHSFVESHAREWLIEQAHEELRRLT